MSTAFVYVRSLGRLGPHCNQPGHVHIIGQKRARTLCGKQAIGYLVVGEWQEEGLCRRCREIREKGG